MNNGVQIGLRDLYYALLLTDPVAGTPTYGTPAKIAGAINANINPNGSNEVLFADDGPFETASALGQIGLELSAADIPMDVQAVLLGHTIEGGIMKRKSSDIPPWVAIGFRSLKSNGKYKYTWLDKGKFALPEQKSETRGDKIAFQTPTMSGSFVKRDSDDEWERHADEDHVDYVPTIGSNWFLGPLGVAGDLVAPVISSVVPADAATAVAKNTVITWNFSKALALSTVTTGSFTVHDANDTLVTGTLAINAARTQVTFTPSSALGATLKYYAVVSSAVKDINGNALAATSVTSFTTTA